MARVRSRSPHPRGLHVLPHIARAAVCSVCVGCVCARRVCCVRVCSHVTYVCSVRVCDVCVGCVCARRVCCVRVCSRSPPRAGQVCGCENGLPTEGRPGESDSRDHMAGAEARRMERTAHGRVDMDQGRCPWGESKRVGPVENGEHGGIARRPCGENRRERRTRWGGWHVPR